MLCRRGLRGCLCNKEARAELQVKLGGIRVERKNESQGERKSYYLGGGEKKKNSDQGTNGPNLFFPFTTVQVYKKHSGRHERFFLSDAPRPDPSVKVSSFPFCCVRARKTQRCLYIRKNSPQARAKLQNYSRGEIF